MRKFVLALAAFSIAVPAMAQTHVRGYTRKDGTYVAPHVRSAPNSSRYDNWSTAPNVNPYTGKTGTVDPYALPSFPTYRAPTYQAPTYKAPAYAPPCVYFCPK
jgi:hypothetical protein